MERITAVDLRTFLSNNNVEHNLRRLIHQIAITCKYISSKINEANRKYAVSKNVSGEQQLELDKAADQIFIKRMECCAYVKQLASEEQDEIVSVLLPEQSNNAEYSITVDPLDGSSLIDVNLAVGSIIGIHKGELCLKNEHNLIAAMYVLYGPLTTLILSTGNGTHEFVLNPEGEFVLACENIKMKEKGNIYSIGGVKKEWTEKHKRYIEHLEDEGYKLRYSGGLVPDVNQILLKNGGLFTYPALINSKNGKLRLLFELQPLSFIIEQAGGAAIDGKNRILDIKPETLHQRSPIYIGSKHEVNLAKDYLM